MLLLLFLLCVVIFVYYKLYLPLQYWKKTNIPHIQPSPIVGNLGPVIFRKENFNDYSRSICNKFKDHRYFGLYQFLKPTLVVLDTELIKRIYIKDFEYFSDHYEFLPREYDRLWGKVLFSLDGNDWREMRSVLSPSFTSSKMKGMFYLVAEASERFVKHYIDQDEMVTLEIMHAFNKYTNDAIASCIYGIDCNTMSNERNEFYSMAKEAFTVTGCKLMKFFACALSPTLANIFGVRMFSKKVTKFFMKITKETMEYRDRTGLYRPDIMHLLMEAKKDRLRFEEEDDKVGSDFVGIEKSYFGKQSGSNKIPITDEDITSQAIGFYLGSYDTVALALSQTAYELAANMDVQEKLIKEIDSTLAQCNGKITYDALFQMKYLDMVISEAMRLWPPPLHTRKCVKPFLIEKTLPHEKDHIVEKGSEVIILIYATHRNPEYFENPDKFDPERFSDENKKNIKPYTYFPFGIGPRHCIGYRFALMMMKHVLIDLLAHFQLVPVEKTVIPFEQAKGSLILRSAHGYWFGLKPRKDN